jgi:chromosomal replication initiator protein
MKNSIEQIQSIVSTITGVSINDIKSPSRKANIVQARHLSMYFCRFNTRNNTLLIAKDHGRDNHATVLHACNCIHSDRKTNKRLNEMYQQIESQIKTA